MTIVLFRIITGTKVSEFDDESIARQEMRAYNAMYGYIGKTTFHWENGIEMEMTSKGIGPYGITEYDRWNLKFNPANQTNLIDNSPIEVQD